MTQAEVTALVEPCPLDEAETQRIVQAALAHGQRKDLWLGVVFAPDELMIKLHGDYLDDPTPTDVITFDLESERMPGMPESLAAELYVGVEEAQRVAAIRGVEFRRELALYVVHGCLHLCGFDDHNEADSARMRVAEQSVMAALGFVEDSKPHHM